MAVVDMAPRVDMIIVEKVEIEPIIITTTNGNPIVETKAKPVWTRSMKRACGGYASTTCRRLRSLESYQK